MTPIQMALSQLAQHALKNASEQERPHILRLTAVALSQSCPEVAQLSAKAAAAYEEASYAQLELIKLLEPDAPRP